MNIIK